MVASGPVAVAQPLAGSAVAPAGLQLSSKIASHDQPSSGKGVSRLERIQAEQAARHRSRADARQKEELDPMDPVSACILARSCMPALSRCVALNDVRASDLGGVRSLRIRMLHAADGPVAWRASSPPLQTPPHPARCFKAARTLVPLPSCVRIRRRWRLRPAAALGPPACKCPSVILCVSVFCVHSKPWRLPFECKQADAQPPATELQQHPRHKILLKCAAYRCQLDWLAPNCS